MNLSPVIETGLRAALAAKISTVAQNLIVDEPVIDSKHDEIDLLTRENVDGELETVFGKLDFLKFEDSSSDGCDDEPLVTLFYKLHLFQQFKEKRSDNSTSANDFVALVLNLRNKFLESNRRLVSSNIEHLPLRQLIAITLGEDPLMGAEGHFADFEIKVQIS